jgi:hypothetical protein
MNRGNLVVTSDTRTAVTWSRRTSTSGTARCRVSVGPSDWRNRTKNVHNEKDERLRGHFPPFGVGTEKAPAKSRASSSPKRNARPGVFPVAQNSGLPRELALNAVAASDAAWSTNAGSRRSAARPSVHLMPPRESGDRVIGVLADSQQTPRTPATPAGWAGVKLIVIERFLPSACASLPLTTKECSRTSWANGRRLTRASTNELHRSGIPPLPSPGDVRDLHFQSLQTSRHVLRDPAGRACPLLPPGLKAYSGSRGG